METDWERERARAEEGESSRGRYRERAWEREIKREKGRE